MVLEVLWAKLVFSTSKSSAEEFFMAGALSWILAGYKDPHVGFMWAYLASYIGLVLEIKR
jgi:hypothetical protein